MWSRPNGTHPNPQEANQHGDEWGHWPSQGHQMMPAATIQPQVYNQQYIQAQFVFQETGEMVYPPHQHSQQAYAFIQNNALEQPNVLQYQQSANTYTTNGSTPTQGAGNAIQSTRVINAFCNNCGSVGHRMQFCMKKIDNKGYMTGCPPCNTTMHNYRDPQACKYPYTSTSDLYFIVICRHNRPPLKVSIDYRYIMDFAKSLYRPWTADYTLRMKARGFLATFKHQVQVRDETLVADPVWGDILTFNKRYPPGTLKHPDYLQPPKLSAPRKPPTGEGNREASVPQGLPLTARQLKNARRRQRLKPKLRSLESTVGSSSGRRIQAEDTKTKIISELEKTVASAMKEVHTVASTSDIPPSQVKRSIPTTPKSMLLKRTLLISKSKPECLPLLAEPPTVPKWLFRVEFRRQQLPKL
ncbi:hypothetical protein HYALB_00009808 [Hymenoscyphus albidus]|uniref:CCHC-type domain-containing protein n=1 Tax=Hymenoscyphus albidus TaxID=595503 RepID=A0A9N9LFU9_9HELO|nr:hypothetical protein HYALB_00009808 [Hymenoscyphus albidus]